MNKLLKSKNCLSTSAGNLVTCGSKNDDILEYFWREQEEFQRLVFNKDISKLSLGEKKKLTKEFILHITTEFDELLKAIGGWKTHKLENTIPKERDIAEEIIDILKFLINICLIWNITPKNLIEKFEEKSILNRQLLLQQRRFEKIKNEKVIIFDIDGVLNDYPEKFIKFVNKELGTNFLIEDYLDIKRKISIEEYNNLKTRFREKYDHRILPKARKILKQIKERGFNIVFITARNYKNHKHLATRLIYQLHIQRIPYDIIIFTDEKDVIAKEFKNLVLAIDDEPEYIIKYCDVGIKAILLNKPYNRKFNYDRRIDSIDNIFKHL